MSGSIRDKQLFCQFIIFNVVSFDYFLYNYHPFEMKYEKYAKKNENISAFIFTTLFSIFIAIFSGHFTQMVWLSSRYFGVGKARSRCGKLVVVAHYSPPGNITGTYMRNVLPPVEEFPRLPPPHSPRLIVAGSTTSGSDRSTTGST